MPSTFAHAAAAVTIGLALRPGRALPRRYWTLGVIAAAVPDLDAIGRPFGPLELEALAGGHRGFTHSLTFAVVLGALMAWQGFRGADWDGLRPRLWLYLALATASHGLIDMLASYGGGVALLAPFSWTRFAWPWQPLGASGGCQGAARCLWAGTVNELLWIGLPLAAAVTVIAALRSRRSAGL